MVRISKLADYAVVVLVYIAQHPELGHNARDLAGKTHISLPTVSKIMKAMAKSGLLVSQRGAKGGYRLARSADAISVADILNAIDGRFAMTDCAHHDQSCALESVCNTATNWRLISRTIYTALDALKLSDMARPLPLTKTLAVLERMQTSQTSFK